MPVRRILLVGHTRHDVGYTSSPRIVDPLHAAIVGEVPNAATVTTATVPTRPVDLRGGRGPVGAVGAGARLRRRGRRAAGLSDGAGEGVRERLDAALR